MNRIICKTLTYKFGGVIIALIVMGLLFGQWLKVTAAVLIVELIQVWWYLFHEKTYNRFWPIRDRESLQNKIMINLYEKYVEQVWKRLKK